MPDPSMPEREPPKLVVPRSAPLLPNRTSAFTTSEIGFAETDLADLASVFATHGGGRLSAQVSADLALEIVLNEIVEQACVAASGTGAAIALMREGEMVCRASSGVNAPEIGARLASEVGLTAECVRTRQVQRCDDAQADARADVEASRSLGVRSVVIVPLIHHGDLVGLLEVFSSRPAAFKDRDEATLETFADRVLKSLDEASATVTSATITDKKIKRTAQFPDGAGVVPMSMSTAEFEDRSNSEELEPDEAQRERRRNPRGRFDLVTVMLGAAIVVCAVLIGILLGARLGWTKEKRLALNHRTALGSDRAVVAAEPTGAAMRSPRMNTGATSGTNPVLVAGKSTVPPGEKDARESSSAPAPVRSATPVGSLLVYENGKEIFRMLPGDRTEASGAKAIPVRPNGTLEQAGIVELSTDAAESSLLYRVEPEYPEQARQRRIQGPVVLSLRIGDDGTIQEVKVLTGDRLLADAAIAAVKQWRFKPRMLEGHPVEMQTRVTLNFKISS